MVPLLAFSLQDQVEKFGAYVGVGAFVGLAVLTLLHFAQARELRRLREWAGRAPERAQEIEARAVAQAEAAREAQAARPAATPAAAAVGPAAATAAAARSGTVGPAMPIGALTREQAEAAALATGAEGAQPATQVIEPAAGGDGDGKEAHPGAPSDNGGPLVAPEGEPAVARGDGAATTRDGDAAAAEVGDGGTPAAETGDGETAAAETAEGDAAAAEAAAGERAGGAPAPSPPNGVPAGPPETVAGAIADGSDDAPGSPVAAGSPAASASPGTDAYVAPPGSPAAPPGSPGTTGSPAAPPGSPGTTGSPAAPPGSPRTVGSPAAPTGASDTGEIPVAPVPRATPVPRRTPAPAAPLRAPSHSATVPPRGPQAPVARKPLPSVPGDGASPSRGTRTTVLVVGLGVLVLAAVGFGATQLLGGDDPPPAPNRASAPTAEPSAAAGQGGGLTPATAQVAVLNGTVTGGLASDTADKIAGAGFKRDNISTGNNTDQQRAQSSVLFGDGARSEARTIGRLLKISKLQPLDADTRSLANDADVVVILGADQTP